MSPYLYNSLTQIVKVKDGSETVERIDYFCGETLGPVDRIVIDLHTKRISPMQAQVLIKNLLIGQE